MIDVFKKIYNKKSKDHVDFLVSCSKYQTIEVTYKGKIAANVEENLLMVIIFGRKIAKQNEIEKIVLSKEQFLRFIEQ